MNLAHLIDPVSVDEFRRDYWEQKPLRIHRNDGRYYDHLMTLAEIDNILSTSSLRSSDLRVVAEGTETPISEIINPANGGPTNGLEALYERYRNGATINLMFLHERWEPLATLCRSLSAELSCGFQTNVYLTPAGGAQGLKPHYDTHDVFALQVHGTKHWRLYDSPLKLPLQSQSYSAPQQGPGEPVEEFHLCPGDLLYLPRGTVHAATSKDEASLHLTIGVLPVLWATLLRNAVDRAIAGDALFRAGLPLGFAHDESLQSAATAQARELVGALAEKLSADDMVAEAARLSWLNRQPALRGHILDLEAARSVSLDTPVRRRPELFWRLRHDESSVFLEFHGKVIRMPRRVSEELHFVVEKDEFTPRDIPGDLDEPSRITLVRKLISEGCLTLVR